VGFFEQKITEFLDLDHSGFESAILVRIQSNTALSLI